MRSVHGVVIMLLVAGVGATSPDEVRAAVRQVLDDSYQQALPAPDPGAGAEEPSRLALDGHRSLPETTAVQLVARGLMWILIAVTVVLIGAWLFGELRRERRTPATTGQDEVETARAGPADVVERPLGDAEALAAAGRYGEAIHILLLRTLEALVRRAGAALPASLTSREILARVALADEARAALGHLVQAVEISHFGDTVPAAADYATCVARFQRFAAVYA